jgi:hypothetical protein
MFCELFHATMHTQSIRKEAVLTRANRAGNYHGPEADEQVMEILNMRKQVIAFESALCATLPVAMPPRLRPPAYCLQIRALRSIQSAGECGVKSTTERSWL